MLKDSNDNSYWSDYFDHIGLFFIFIACAGISIIVWIFNWICWLNQCCCCDFLHNPINKRIAWWTSFSFLLGVLACCISAFVYADNFYNEIEGAWCAFERIYYDSLYGQLKTSEPMWEGFESVTELSNKLSDFYAFIKNNKWENILIPNDEWTFNESLALWLNDSISSNEQKLLVNRYTKIIFSLKHLSNLNYNKQDNVLKNIFDENEFVNIKKNFLDEFDYYSRTISACLYVLVMIYYCLLLITITFAGVALMFYACLKRQGYLLKLMHILWNVIRFFMFSFFLYGTAYGIGFLSIRDSISYLMYVFNENLSKENPKLIEGGEKFFETCLLKKEANLKNFFDKIYTSSLQDFFINYHEIMNDNIENKYGDINSKLNILRDNYTNQNQNQTKSNYFESLVEKSNNEGGIFGSFDCSFLKNDLNILYTALYDASVESRILCALSLCSSFFGAIAVYFFLLVLHHYNNELFFDNGKSIFTGFEGFGGGYRKANINQEPKNKKRKLRAEIELSSVKTGEQNEIKGSQNKEEIN